MTDRLENDTFRDIVHFSGFGFYTYRVYSIFFWIKNQLPFASPEWHYSWVILKSNGIKNNLILIEIFSSNLQKAVEPEGTMEHLLRNSVG